MESPLKPDEEIQVCFETLSDTHNYLAAHNYTHVVMRFQYGVRLSCCCVTDLLLSLPLSATGTNRYLPKDTPR